MKSKDKRMTDVLHTQIELLIDRDFIGRLDKDVGYFVLVMKRDRKGAYITTSSNIKAHPLYNILQNWIVENIKKEIKKGVIE